MPTADEVRAQLTGPGGMFEVVTEEVLGRPTQVYASRMPSLRSVAEVGGMRGDDQTFLVYGARTYGFGEFVSTANGVALARLTRLDSLALQGATADGVEAAVIDGLPGDIDGLLGLSFLTRFDFHLDAAAGRLRLAARRRCRTRTCCRHRNRRRTAC